MLIAALYALGMAVLLVYGLNLLALALVHAWNDRLLPGEPPEPDALPPPAEAPCLVVTVQLPLYNEAYVAERLIDACARLDWPSRRLEIQVLDDSTDETTALAEARVRHWQQRGLDVVLIHRDRRAGYKAGALANGLRLARGDTIAVFDADFVPPPDVLRRTVPLLFSAPDVGMVQARWGHLNPGDTLLTGVQAFGLDTHFAIEQRVRERLGCFMNFNGTAGVWRRACIEEAGGWQSDTLTEDLDLSYRAQLRGWRFHYAGDVEVPAELPVSISAFRAQQFRWTKGAIETALKVLRPLWTSAQPRRVKWEGTFHLTAHVVYPFVLLVALLHAPLLWMAHTGQGPGAGYFALMGLGLAGFAGFFLAQLFAQRHLYPRWGRRLALFPVFMAGSMGMACSNTLALGQALLGRRTAFVRTPKSGRRAAAQAGAGAHVWWKGRYAEARLAPVVWAEALLALYCIAGLSVVVGIQAWAAVPFQALFALGFSLVTAWNAHLFWRTRRDGG